MYDTRRITEQVNSENFAKPITYDNWHRRDKHEHNWPKMISMNLQNTYFF